MLYIVVDSNDRPMTFNEDQFYYVRSRSIGVKEGKRFINFVRIYSYDEAKELIKKHDKFRRENNFGTKLLRLMPAIDKNTL